jgi:LuxR family quorum sensing-dependent transcriptional regulator
MGNTHQQIATKLGITELTVDKYFWKAYRALGASGLLEALALTKQRHPDFMARTVNMEIIGKRSEKNIHLETPRMLECLELAAMGNTRLQIARKLGVSNMTVNKYFAKAYRALGASGLLEALALTKQRYPDFMARTVIMEVIGKRHEQSIHLEGNPVRI